MNFKFINLFKIIELRKRLFFTLAFLAIYRSGIFITTPGIDRLIMKDYLNFTQNQGNILNLFNFFSGGALERGSIFALGIMPYITSSIIMSLIIVIVPYFERLQKEGEHGRIKINQYTRYGAILISFIQSIMVAKYFKTQSVNGKSIIQDEWLSFLDGFGFIFITVLTLTAGTAFIIWLGEKITERGIGNGISLIIFSGIVVRLPVTVYSMFVGFKFGTYKTIEIIFLLVFMFLVLAIIVFIEKGQRRIPIQYSKRIIRTGQNLNHRTHLPLKINISGVIPPIFASTLLMLPSTLTSLTELKWIKQIQTMLSPGSWQYYIIFISLIVFFSYFYAALQFNPMDIADNMRKFGGFIPGIRPGKPTSKYINYVISRITFGGSIYLSIVCLIPMIIQKFSSNKIPFVFGGTGLLIVVSVALDTIVQIEGHFITKEYDSFSKNIIRIKARAECETSEIA